MEIVRENKSELNDIIKISITPEDYMGNVTSMLKKYQKTADIKGFRKGAVPFGMVQKLFGKAAKLEEVQKASIDALYKYIKDNEIDLIGEPIPTSEFSETDLETLENFTFNFEIGIKPDLQIDLTTFEIERNRIIIDDFILNENIENLRSKYGTYDKFNVVSENSMVYGDFVVLDENSNPTEKTNPSSIYMEKLGDSEADLKSKLIGLNLEENLDFDVSMASETSVARWFAIKSEDMGTISKIRFTPKEIVNVTPRELNKEFFDMIFPDENVETEEDFREKLRDINKQEFISITDKNFVFDVLDKLEKDINFNIPVDFLKRWVLYNNKENDTITEELVEQELPMIEKSYKRQIIETVILKKENYVMNQEDILGKAKSELRQRFISYGYNVDDETLDKQMVEFLKDEKRYKEIIDSLINEKLLEIFNKNLKIIEKEITFDEYKTLK